MRGPRVIYSILLSFVSFAISIIAIEYVLRFTDYTSFLAHGGYHWPLGYFEAVPGEGYDHPANYPPTLDKLPEVEYEVWTNELGCFDSPYNGEDDFTLLVGDSFTHSIAPFESKWGTVLESKIGSRILKCAVSGTGPKEQHYKAIRVIKKLGKTPRLIIVGYFLSNDFGNDYTHMDRAVVIEGVALSRIRYVNAQTGEINLYSDEELEREFNRAKYGFESKIESFLKGRSILYNLGSIVGDPFIARTGLVARRYGQWVPDWIGESLFKQPNLQPQIDEAYSAYYPAEEYPWLEAAWEKHLLNIADFYNYARDIDAQFLLVLIPDKHQVYDDHNYWFKESLHQPVEKVVGLAESMGIPYLNLLPAFRNFVQSRQSYLHGGFSPHYQDNNEDYKLYWTEGHFNIQGNALAGHLVAQYLLSNPDLLTVDSRKAKLQSVEFQLEQIYENGS